MQIYDLQKIPNFLNLISDTKEYFTAKFREFRNSFVEIAGNLLDKVLIRKKAFTSIVIFASMLIVGCNSSAVNRNVTGETGANGLATTVPLSSRENIWRVKILARGADWPYSFENLESLTKPQCEIRKIDIYDDNGYTKIVYLSGENLDQSDLYGVWCLIQFMVEYRSVNSENLIGVIATSQGEYNRFMDFDPDIPGALISVPTTELEAEIIVER